MFGVVRLIAACILGMASTFAINKFVTITKGTKCVVFALISALTAAILTFFPFENMLITFESPEESYSYCNYGRSKVELVIEGDDCAFVVGDKNGTYNYLIIPRSPEGWKIGLGINTKRVAQQFVDGISISIYQYKNSNCFFITILNTDGEKANVSDNCNTSFYSLEKKRDNSNNSYVTYYGFAPCLDSEYIISVNGNEIAFPFLNANRE